MKYSNTHSLFKLIIVVSALWSGQRVCAQNTVASKRPNVVFIIVDDLGSSDLGFTGNTYYETPNIDKLSKQGMVFTNAYANAPNCAPTRASLMSGWYAPRHGIY